MLYVPHFRTFVVIPALEALPDYARTEAAVELLIGTALKESNLQYLRQSYKKIGDGRGRALGVYQMETTTYLDHVKWINKNPNLAGLLFPLGVRPAVHMQGDLYFSTRIARVHYWVRGKDPLPALGDVQGYAAYWGKYWQTQSIPAQMAQFVRLYTEHALPTAPRAPSGTARASGETV
jgi:hypothetical protein